MGISQSTLDTEVKKLNDSMGILEKQYEKKIAEKTAEIKKTQERYEKEMKKCQNKTKAESGKAAQLREQMEKQAEGMQRLQDDYNNEMNKLEQLIAEEKKRANKEMEQMEQKHTQSIEHLNDQVRESSKKMMKLQQGHGKEMERLRKQISDEKELRAERERREKRYRQKMAKREKQHEEMKKELTKIQEENNTKIKCLFNQNVETKELSIRHVTTYVKRACEAFIKQRAEYRTKYDKEFNKSFQKLVAEKKNLQKFEDEREDPNILRLVMVGATGNGKSSVCNRFSKQWTEEMDVGPFTVSGSVNSETQKIRKVIVDDLYGRSVCVVDTPGLMDSDQKDDQHCNNIIEYLRGCGGVNAFIMVKSRIPKRIDDATQTILRDLNKMLGDEFWSHVIFLLTYTDDDIISSPKWKEYCDEFVQKIRSMHSQRGINMKQYALPILGIENEDDGNFKTVIRKLLQKVPTKLFAGEKLRSPLDLLNEELSKVETLLREEEDSLIRQKMDIEWQVKERNKIIMSIREMKQYSPPVLPPYDLSFKPRFKSGVRNVCLIDADADADADPCIYDDDGDDDNKNHPTSAVMVPKTRKKHRIK